LAQTGRTVSPQVIFKEVMGVEENGIRDQGEIELIRVNNRPNCVADNNTRTITCGNLVDYQGQPRSLTHYVLTHEFGHVFDNQSARNGNIPLRDYLQQTRVNTSDITTDIRGPVMGNFINNNSQIVWRRGERGWGSGPGSIYDQAHDINGSPIVQVFTDYQQNPAPYQPDPPRTVEQVANEETAADMFLNWVYRRATGSSGFQNRTWKPNDIDPGSSLACNTTGCSETNPAQPGVTLLGASGDARFAWMNTRMTYIFTVQGWH
ncbi:MAG: hypothetical protein SF162_10625, partial [bacterium]|nr:hypothetical protein [bacterium]